MSEEEFPVAPPTSPTLDVDNKGKVNTVKDFAGGLTLDLDESEIQQAYVLCVEIMRKYQHRTWDSEEGMDRVFSEMEDEVSTRFAEIGVLAKFDRVQRLIDIMGKVPGGEFDKHGLDHERKEYEVKAASAKGEVFLGQKERPLKRKKKNA